jgi:hypothetical protein
VKLLPDALPGAMAFAACRTQWAYAPSGRPTGLRYDACMTALRVHCTRHGIARSELPQLFADMQVMEGAFVRAVADVIDAEGASREHHIPGGGRGHA